MTDTQDNDIEVQKMTPEDADGAKKKGGLFGDPIFVVND